METPTQDARAATVARLRQRIGNSPQAFLDEVGVREGEGGKGYVVGALANLPTIAHTGLRAGDRILSVNGEAVGNPQDDSFRIDDVMTLGSARLEIQRGTRRFTVTVALN